MHEAVVHCQNRLLQLLIIFELLDAEAKLLAFVNVDVARVRFIVFDVGEARHNSVGDIVRIFLTQKHIVQQAVSDKLCSHLNGLFALAYKCWRVFFEHKFPYRHSTMILIYLIQRVLNFFFDCGSGEKTGLRVENLRVDGPQI